MDRLERDRVIVDAMDAGIPRLSGTRTAEWEDLGGEHGATWWRAGTGNSLAVPREFAHGLGLAAKATGDGWTARVECHWMPGGPDTMFMSFHAATSVQDGTRWENIAYERWDRDYDGSVGTPGMATPAGADGKG